MSLCECLLMFEHDIISTDANRSAQRASEKSANSAFAREYEQSAYCLPVVSLFVCALFFVWFMVRVNIGQAAPIDKQNGFK